MPDTSVVNIVQESLTSPAGCLFRYRNMTSGETDFDGLWAALLLYWTAVRDTFPDAWGTPPTRSRLMHSAGIRAMGRLMDRVLATVNPATRTQPTRSGLTWAASPPTAAGPAAPGRV